MQRLLLVTVVLAGLFGRDRLAPADPIDHYVTVLEDNGISADGPSIEKYLKTIHPDSAAIQRLQALIVQLGDDDFHRREAAMAALVKTPVTAPEMLQQAIAGNDLEVRWRARQVLKLADHKTNQILYAVFRVVKERKLEGLSESMLATMSLCEGEYLTNAGRLAIVASARPQDVEMFRLTIRKGTPSARVAAIDALDHLLGPNAIEELLLLLTDDADDVRFAAARTVVNRGRREALPVFVSLLEADQPLVRARSVNWLRSVSGKRFGFLPFDEAKGRAAALQAWKAWLSKEGQTTELIFPIAAKPPLLGRTLICHYNTNRVVEFGADGKETWKADVKMPYGCHGLPNGHRLVASYTGKMVVEFDETGKEVWKAENLPASPFGVRRLSNGNTLVACSDSKKVIELRPDKTIAWEVVIEGRPMDARRLEDGNTLVVLQNAHKVVEVDRSGKEVWRLTGMNNPLSAERLENGNTLVCQMSAGAVVEFDRRGNEVWKHTGLSSPHRAQRLPDGTTIIIDSRGAKIVDVNGKQHWTKLGSGMGGISRF